MQPARVLLLPVNSEAGLPTHLAFLYTGLLRMCRELLLPRGKQRLYAKKGRR